MRRNRFRVAILTFAAVPALAENSQFTVLPNLSGGAIQGSARGLSADGRVVVGSGTDAAGAVAMRWVDGVPEAIGDLPSGRRATHCYSLSPDADFFVGGTLGAWGFVLSDGALLELTAPVGVGIPDVAAYDVSDDGRMAVGRASYFPSSAIRWDDGTPLNLGKLAGSSLGVGAVASGVSADGAIVVGSSDSSSGVQAYRWQSGVFTALGDLAGGAFASGAADVSADGAVIVGFGTTGTGSVAVRWVNGVIGSLGDLPGGETSAFGLGVSRNGSFVVGRGNTVEGARAFVWDAANGLRDVNALLESQGVSLEGLALTSAFAVSDDGRTLAGEGFYEDSSGSFAWTARLGEPPLACPGDLNGDSVVDLADLGIVLANFDGDNVSLHDGDYNCDGQIDLSDLGVVLALFGSRCV